MLASWTDFLSMLAQIAVAMLALLFVSFQIAHERWIGMPARRYVAIQTLLEFLIPSFFAIIALLPTATLKFGHTQFGLWQLSNIVSGIGGLVVSIVIIRYSGKNRNEIDKFLKQQLKFQPVTIIEYFLIIGFSIVGNLFFTSLIMIWLLISGSIETWLFFAELD